MYSAFQRQVFKTCMDPLSGNPPFPKTLRAEFPAVWPLPSALCTPGTVQGPLLSRLVSGDKSQKIHLLVSSAAAQNAQIRPSLALTKKESRNLPPLLPTFSACNRWVMFLCLVALWDLDNNSLSSGLYPAYPDSNTCPRPVLASLSVSTPGCWLSKSFIYLKRPLL